MQHTAAYCLLINTTIYYVINLQYDHDICHVSYIIKIVDTSHSCSLWTVSVWTTCLASLLSICFCDNGLPRMFVRYSEPLRLNLSWGGRRPPWSPGLSSLHRRRKTNLAHVCHIRATESWRSSMPLPSVEPARSLHQPYWRLVVAK